MQHRVDEILRLSSKSEWRHCQGLCNPADLGSRGVTANSLKSSDLWWHGPSWLCSSKSTWPEGLVLGEPPEVKEERKKVNVLTVLEQPKQGISQIIDINRFSKLNKLLRVTSYVNRFIDNLKARRNKQDVDLEPLTLQDISLARRIWTIEVQATLRSKPKHKLLVQQLGIFEENGILRCKDRLENSDLDFVGKFPILLPNGHKFSELVVLNMHSKMGHEGLRVTLTEVRSKYWIPRGRQFVKKIIKPCQTCKKLEAKALKLPPMAPLPLSSGSTTF